MKVESIAFETDLALELIEQQKVEMEKLRAEIRGVRETKAEDRKHRLAEFFASYRRGLHFRFL